MTILDSKELEQRLERWADWARSPSIGGASGVVGYLKERLDRSADSHEMTDEIAITERAMARTKLQNKMYWRVLSRYYLGRLSMVEIALIYHVSETATKAMFLRAVRAVADNIHAIEQNIDNERSRAENGNV